MIHVITLMDLHKMLPTMLTTYVVFDFLYSIQSKESEANALALGNPWTRDLEWVRKIWEQGRWIQVWSWWVV